MQRQPVFPRWLSKKVNETAEDYGEAMFQPCRDAAVDYVVMGGFLKHVLIPDDYVNRVVNIHPSLIPRSVVTVCMARMCIMQ